MAEGQGASQASWAVCQLVPQNRESGLGSSRARLWLRWTCDAGARTSRPRRCCGDVIVSIAVAEEAPIATEAERRSDLLIGFMMTE